MKNQPAKRGEILKSSVWEKEEYFLLAEKVVLSDFLKNFGLKKLKDYAGQASRILDCACGDGVDIEMIWHPKAQFWGIDISKTAINLAKKRFKSNDNVHFKIGNIEKIDFPDESFDLVYIAYALEHLFNPEKVIREMIRVAKKNGCLILISPNYGSPLSFSPSSPPAGETLTTRAIKQFLKSHWCLIKKPLGLDWIKVEPLCLKKNEWKPDWDTVVEPYLQTLIYFLERSELKIIEYKTHLNEEKENEVVPPTLKQKFLRSAKQLVEMLGRRDISPYKYFGPDFLVVAQKI